MVNDGMARRIGRATSRTSDAVARAARFLRDHAGEPIRMRDVSRLAGMSDRGLRNAFRRERGLSPKQYQIRERLIEVRRALCGAGAGQTITDIATQSGFFELGRFARLYRRVYGETPSQTLSHAAGASAATA